MCNTKRGERSKSVRVDRAGNPQGNSVVGHLPTQGGKKTLKQTVLGLFASSSCTGKALTGESHLDEMDGPRANVANPTRTGPVGRQARRATLEQEQVRAKADVKGTEAAAKGSIRFIRTLVSVKKQAAYLDVASARV